MHLCCRIQLSVVTCALVQLLAASGAQARPLLVISRDQGLVREACDLLVERKASPATETYESNLARQSNEHATSLEAIASAQESYRDGDIDTAWEKISQAIAGLERSYGVMRDFEVVARAYLFRADLANAKGNTRTAEDCYLIAARLGGDMELDPATTSPVVIDGYKTAHELLANSPTGGLTLVTKPEGALISVDGQRSGQAPLSLSLPAGPHLVRAQLNDYDVWATQVPVSPDDIRRVEVFLVPTLPIDAAAMAPTPQRMRALLAIDSERDWLVLNREGDEVTYSYLVVGGEVVDGGPLAIAELPAALGPEGSAESIQEEGDPIGWPWLLAAGGGGVAALGTIGALSIESALFFSDAGSGQERLDLQLAERILFGVAVVGVVAGAVGLAFGLAQMEDSPFDFGAGESDESPGPGAHSDEPEDVPIDEVEEGMDFEFGDVLDESGGKAEESTGAKAETP